MFPRTDPLDDFERSDGPLGGDWTTFYGSGLLIEGGQMRPAASWSGAIWATPMPAPHEVYATIGVKPPDNSVVVILELATSAAPWVNFWDGYAVEVGYDYLRLYRLDASAWTTLTTTTADPSAVQNGDGFGLSIEGADVVVYRRRADSWTEVIRVTDATHRADLTHRMIELAPDPALRVDDFGGRSLAGHTASRLYEALAPLASDDAAQGYALRHYCNALARQLDTIADLSRDETDEDRPNPRPGWVVALDPDTAPVDFLPWLGQFVGVRLTGSEAEDDARARIVAREGQRRGTLGALVKAVQDTLTGTKTVLVTERQGASAWAFAVATFSVETPDPAKTEDAARRVKAAGLLMTYNVIADATFAVLRAPHTDFADVTATFADFDEVRENPSKQ